MADVYLHVTHPGVIEEGKSWPPKPDEPVRSDQETFFPPSGNPTSNSQAVTIMRNEAPPDPMATPISTAEATFSRTGQPVSNEQGAGVLFLQQQERPAKSESSLIAGPSNTEVKIIPGPPPISNDKEAGTIHHNSVAGSVTRSPGPVAPPHPFGGAISNERYVSLSPPPPPQPQTPVFIGQPPGPLSIGQQPESISIGQPSAPDAFPFSIGQPSAPTSFPLTIGQPSSNDEARFVRQEPRVITPNTDTFMAPSAGLVVGGNPDAQILEGRGTPITADTDRTIGGGGNMTRTPRSEEISIEGKAQHILTCGCGSTKFGIDPADLPNQLCSPCGGYTSIFTCLGCGKKSCSMAHPYGV